MGVLLQVLLSFMRIGVLSFGGAYAAVPLVEREVVLTRGWLSATEFANLLAIDELTPGPILINSATFVGMRVAGVPGAIIATLGCILPSCAISLLLIVLYRRFSKAAPVEGALRALKCMACGLIASTLLTMAMRTVADVDALGSVFSVAVIAGAFYLLNQRRVGLLPVLLGCGVHGVVASML